MKKSKNSMKLLATVLTIVLLLSAVATGFSGCQPNKPVEVAPGEDTTTTTTASTENQGDSAPSEKGDEAEETTTTTVTTTTAPTTTTTTKATTTTTKKPTTTTKATERTNSKAEIEALEKELEDLNMTEEVKEAIQAPCRFCGAESGPKHNCFMIDGNCPYCGAEVKANICHDCP